MEQDVLIKSVDGYVGTITLNRPERRNALSPELLMELHFTLSAWAESGQVRCVVITGAGDKAFSSGYDISAIPTDLTPEMEDLIRNHNPLELAFNSIRNFPYPVIAMWNGYCYGAGMNLSICCDIRIAADTAKAGMPPARLGLVYHPDGLRQFVEALGFAATRELFLTARTFTATECLEMGLVNHVIPLEQLQSWTMNLARDTASNAPLSMKHMKRILNLLGQGVGLSGDDLAEAERLVREGFASDDLKEGQLAFLEKRKPNFQGK
ncbi:MAG: enoyl-CoA hydratase-related protein [Pseudomonadota bacterium]